MKKMMRFTVMALLAAGILIFGGCPDKIEDDPPFDSTLAGSWSNGESGNNLRTFIIDNDGSFSATLNPGGGQGMGRVNGKLVKVSENEYIMKDMIEITYQSWGDAVSLYNGEYIVITLSDNNNTFTLISDTPAVDTYFGGTYDRQQ